MNSYSEKEKLVIYAQQIHDSGIDITPDQKQWTEIAYVCASQGEAGREPFHLICGNFPRYSREECDRHFSYCLRTSRNCLSLGTLVKFANDHGIELKLPRGRRQKSDSQRKEEESNRIQTICNSLTRQAEWRFDTWRQRPEVKELDQEWRPVQDRDLDTFYCRLLEEGLNVKAQDVKALIFSRDFCPNYDPIRSWLTGLKPWNPETDPDYLHDFYIGHLGFTDPENEPFYESMLKKWHVGMVALILGFINENPMMPIFKGPQHIGKTFFVRNILPPELSDYRLEVGPSERIDKDFIISLSETPLIIFDEISFGSSQKNEAFKYIITSSRSNVRDSYARFREVRVRRASLVATTNDDNFIRESEGSRRYLVIDLKETVDLVQFPLPYEGAYAQALYMLEHGYQPKPTQEESQLITEHNRNYMEQNDCREALLTTFAMPDGLSPSEAVSSGDIMRELSYRGFHGREFSANSIGKAMRQLGFESKIIRGTRKYLVVKVDSTQHDRENKQDAQEFIPEVF